MSKNIHKPGRPKLAREDSYNPHTMRMLDSEWQLFEDAAKAKGVTVSAWIRDVATRAAKRALKSQ